MKKRLLLFLPVIVLLMSFSVRHVNASGGVNVIQPGQEIVDTAVGLNPSGTMVGSISVADGFIRFYVIGPSNKIIIFQDKTAFEPFNFSIAEPGNYTIHMANVWSENNVTATLDYGVNFVAVMTETLHVVSTMASTITTVNTTPPESLLIFNPIDLIEGLEAMAELGSILAALIGYLRWRKKHQKPPPHMYASSSP